MAVYDKDAADDDDDLAELEVLVVLFVEGGRDMQTWAFLPFCCPALTIKLFFRQVSGPSIPLVLEIHFGNKQPSTYAPTIKDDSNRQ